MPNKLYHIPESFTIAGMTYQVEFVEFLKDADGNEVYGLYNPSKQLISISTKVNHDNEIVNLSDDLILTTFFHELTHVFNWHWDGGADECLAQVFAGFMLEYIKSKK